MKRALLLIDVQKGFEEPVWGVRNNPDAEKQMAQLLSFWREKALPVIHVQHCSVEKNSPLRADAPGNDFKDFAQPEPGEIVFTKAVNSAFIGTELENHLNEQGINALVVVGLTTDHCVSTTTRMAGNLGFDVTLVSDATACYDRKGPDGIHHTAEDIHAVHLTSLHNEFCTVQNTAEVLAAV